MSVEHAFPEIVVFGCGVEPGPSREQRSVLEFRPRVGNQLVVEKLVTPTLASEMFRSRRTSFWWALTDSASLS